MKFTYKDIKLVGQPYDEYCGEEWHQEFTIKGHHFSSLNISLIDGKYMPHVNPHPMDGKGMSLREQALAYFAWYHQEWFADMGEDVPEEFVGAEFA